MPKKPKTAFQHPEQLVGLSTLTFPSSSTHNRRIAPQPTATMTAAHAPLHHPHGRSTILRARTATTHHLPLLASPGTAWRHHSEPPEDVRAGCCPHRGLVRPHWPTRCHGPCAYWDPPPRPPTRVPVCVSFRRSSKSFVQHVRRWQKRHGLPA
ncbi:hypothetical protein BCR44DRAFT_1200852 [Catenaria anguillulae PL171]|uniref:Uncharacterized protein n=1 Tax=Catenaria anguillulae PL171 TaxID=765915 RepID=A0A1Y2HFG0_9FUNG|nr:hypothetical protein BCR44DRAFT_1200852 [Catenaria anguillulae PL171]